MAYRLSTSGYVETGESSDRITRAPVAHITATHHAPASRNYAITTRHAKASTLHVDHAAVT